MSRKTYDRAAVLGTAMQVFWERGFHGTSIHDLCEATGLNRKTLYAEFQDKQRLHEEALALYTRTAIEQTAAILSAEPLGADNIRRYFGGMHYESPCRGCLMTMTINERALVPPASLNTVAAALQTIEGLLVRNLEAEGLDAATSHRIATFLVFTIQGITTMGKLEGDNQRLAATIETALSIVPS